MSLFKTILAKIFPQQGPAAAPRVTPVPPAPQENAMPDRGAASAMGATSGAAAGAAFGGASNPTPVSTPAPSPPVDVSALMDGLAAAHPEKLDWKRSIVDLLKLLEMDSSLTSRKELAAELDYPGDMGDSAKMNVWLHKQVLRKVAENGGQVPADLLA